jgi:hypothetical protein
MRKLRVMLLAAVLSGGAPVLQAQDSAAIVIPPPPLPAMPFPPRDEGSADADWMRFRNELLSAVQRKDLVAVMNAVAPDVRNGIGRPDGHEEFRRQWSVGDVDSPLWRELPRALSLGAVYYQNERIPRSLCAPYVLPYWPADSDWRSNGAITVKDSPMRVMPSVNSPVINTLGHVIVRVIDWEVADTDQATRQKWVKITVDGKDGFIPEEQIRSPIEHLACFRRSSSGWQLHSLLAAGE